jgi:hypothetical protein
MSGQWSVMFANPIAGLEPWPSPGFSFWKIQQSGDERQQYSGAQKHMFNPAAHWPRITGY